MDIGWDYAKDIVKSRLPRRFSRLSFKGVRYPGIDEISIQKGHITLIMDLERDNDISAAAMERGVKGVQETAWQTCQSGPSAQTCLQLIAVIEPLSSAPLVFDYFHFFKLVNDTLT